jgi:hypothetical protein
MRRDAEAGDFGQSWLTIFAASAGLNQLCGASRRSAKKNLPGIPGTATPAPPPARTTPWQVALIGIAASVQLWRIPHAR